MKTFEIYKAGMYKNDLCCEINARNEKTALLKYRKSQISSGQYWFEKHGNYELYSSYGGMWFAVEKNH